MRDRLTTIAADVSKLVYALEGNGAGDTEESLFERVQKFAGDGPKAEDKPARVSAPPRAGRSKRPRVSDRLASLRNQTRN
jgi:hypothetical protein